MSQVHQEDRAQLVHPMLSVADLVGRAGIFLMTLWVSGKMQTLLSHVSHICSDVFVGSFFVVDEKEIVFFHFCVK